MGEKDLRISLITWDFLIRPSCSEGQGEPSRANENEMLTPFF